MRMADHIIAFDNVLSPAHCERLIARFEAAPEQELAQLEDGYRFTQLDVTRHWPDENEALIPLFMSYFNQYGLAVKAHFWPPKFSYEHLRLKRYLPDSQEFFSLHVDVMSHDAARRFMTAMIYLNAPEAGETVFPTLGVSIVPQQGKFVAFPPLWMFPHEGRPPRGGPKYILHTYLCYPAQPSA
jgi:hypothetical protein